MKSFVGVLGEVFRGFLTTNESSSHHQRRRLQKRRLCFEALENREFLSAGSFDNNDYANNYAEDFYNNSVYYSSGGSDACCECCEDDDKFCECDSHEKDNWQVTLSGPALVNGLTPSYSESIEESFDVTITRTNPAVNADTSYPVSFDLTFSGTATKDDFNVYNGVTLISNDGARWLSNGTKFRYEIPASQTSITLTFKLVDNQTLEASQESLTIGITNANAEVECTTRDFQSSGSVTINVKNDSLNVKWQTITGNDANKTSLSGDSQGRGQRIFPEQTTPSGTIENKFELVFELEAAATANTTLYFKIFDPDILSV